MKYSIVSMAILSCILFESECGFGRFLEKAGRDIGKASQNIAKASEREVRNFNEGTIQPMARNTKRAYNNYVQPELRKTEKNISKNNDRLKSWFHREAQPKVKEWYHGTFLKEVTRIEHSIRDLRDRILRDETNGIDEAIQTIDVDIDKLKIDESRSVNENKEDLVADGPDNTEINNEISIAEKELEVAQTSLQIAELKRSSRVEELGAQLTKGEKSELDLAVLQEKFNVQVKELEILRLKSALEIIG